MAKKNNINRRSFFKQTAGLAGSLVFPYFIPEQAMGKNGSVAPADQITLGCIGVGDHGTSVNLKTFLEQADARILAVCDVDRSRMTRAQILVNQKYQNSDCSTYEDFRDVLARSDIDAVVISTPDHWHVPISVYAIHAGKDVFCEKPTLTVSEGRILSDTVKQYSRVFQTATEDRSVPVYHRMAELVRNGRIGRLHTIRVKLPIGEIQGDYASRQKPEPVPDGFNYDLWLGPAPWAPYSPGRCHYNFRWISDYSGGVLTDWGAHLFDTAQWANDTEHTGPIEVDAKGKFPTGGIYNTAVEFKIEYTYANGVKMFAETGGIDLKFEGTDGWVGNTGWRGDMQAGSPEIFNSFIGPNDIRLYTCPAGEQRNFLDCVKSRRDPYFPAEIGHRCATVMHIANIGMKLGRKLRWDPSHECFIGDDSANSMLSRPMRSPWRL
jgi:myo-inositol 2-dehydrogenase / D-chiro-inositol 1-dehydrogenase